MVPCWAATAQQPQEENSNVKFTPYCVSTDVHPDRHADRLHVPQRLCVPRDALHAQGLRHPLPPRAERSEEEAKFQGARVARGGPKWTLPSDWLLL